MNPSLAVVIPYYQRRPGILGRALAAVARQSGLALDTVRVIVVDDQSPVPAEIELQAHPTGLSVTLLKRSNGGPGAARNTALDSLPPSIEYVAFLDSDDEWAKDHLASALQALEQVPASFYFSNFLQLGATTPAFERAGRLELADHRLMVSDLYDFMGEMDTQILTGNLIGTSTVVYRFTRHAKLRFRPEYRRAGEDYLMWLDFWRDGAKFVFRSTPSVTYKEGVNVFSGVEWGTVEHLERTRDEIRYLSAALNDYAVSDALKTTLRGRIADRRRHYWHALRSSLRKAPLRTIRHLASY